MTRHGCCEDLHLENEVGEEDQTEQVGGLELALFFLKRYVDMYIYILL